MILQLIEKTIKHNFKIQNFKVQNCSFQGSTVTSALFIMYFDLVIANWLSQFNVAGVEVQFKLGGKLVGGRTRRPT